MQFHTFTTTQESCRRSGGVASSEEFYTAAFADAIKMGSGQFYGQLINERTWEQARKPYYNVWPSVVPMLTRLNLDLDSSLIRLPVPVLCVRLPVEGNPLSFDWQGKPVDILSMLLGTINDGRGLSLLIDVGEMMGDGQEVGVPIFTYRNFRRQEGVTVEEAILELGPCPDEPGVRIPEALILDCIRLCCSLCLLENDPSVIEPDVLSKDRAKFQQTGEEKYIDKAHRRGKVGWNVGRRIEVAPHYRRPHMALVWTGAGRAVPRVVPRRGSVVHREKVEKVPSGFGG